MASSALTNLPETALPAAILKLKNSIIRPYHQSDTESLVLAADNVNVTRNLRHRFPSPYTLADAKWWIDHCSIQSPLANFAIIHPSTGAVMGTIGLDLGTDVHCRTAELGYWLGEQYWGQGVMSEAASAFVNWAFENVKVKDNDGMEVGLTRIYAGLFARNKASESVIKRAGLLFEGTCRASLWKDGEIMDQVIYAITLKDWEKKREKC